MYSNDVWPNRALRLQRIRHHRTASRYYHRSRGVQLPATTSQGCEPTSNNRCSFQGITGHSLTFNGRGLGITTATLQECAVEAGCTLRVALPLKVLQPPTSPCSPRACQGGGNGLRTCQRARGVNTSLMLRRTDSTMLASDASGHIVQVPAPRIAHKRQMSFSRNQVVWSRSNASQLQNKKCKTFHSNWIQHNLGSHLPATVWRL